MLSKLSLRYVATGLILSTTLSLGCRGSAAQARNSRAHGDSNVSGPSLGRGPDTDAPHSAGRSAIKPARSTTSLRGEPQQTCPVTGAQLGSIGDPVPVTVKGETILVCCQRCVKKVQQDPDKYLARVRDETAGRR